MKPTTATVPFDLESKSVTEQKTDNGEFGLFQGYASTFSNRDHDDDIIMPGAFAESLKSGRRIKMLWQHNFGDPIGGYTAVREDSKGLYVEGRINLGTQKGRDAYALLKAGDIDSMSIGFRTKQYEIDRAREVRLLKQVDLYEISLVTVPANSLATVTNVKSVEKLQSLAEIEDNLRKHGYSKDAAIKLISMVKSVGGNKEGEPTLIETASGLSESDAQRIAFQLKSITHNLRMTQNV